MPARDQNWFTVYQAKGSLASPGLAAGSEYRPCRAMSLPPSGVRWQYVDHLAAAAFWPPLQGHDQGDPKRSRSAIRVCPRASDLRRAIAGRVPPPGRRRVSMRSSKAASILWPMGVLRSEREGVVQVEFERRTSSAPHWMERPSGVALFPKPRFHSRPDRGEQHIGPSEGAAGATRVESMVRRGL
jgi:hypothetical protein